MIHGQNEGVVPNPWDRPASGEGPSAASGRSSADSTRSMSRIRTNFFPIFPSPFK